MQREKKMEKQKKLHARSNYQYLFRHICLINQRVFNQTQCFTHLCLKKHVISCRVACPDWAVWMSLCNWAFGEHARISRVFDWTVHTDTPHCFIRVFLIKGDEWIYLVLFLFCFFFLDGGFVATYLMLLLSKDKYLIKIQIYFNNDGKCEIICFMDIHIASDLGFLRSVSLLRLCKAD